MTLVQPPVDRPVLPLTPTTRHGSRSLMTCFFRCGNACDHPEPNRTDNGHIQDEIATALQRRAVLKGAAVGSGALVLGGAAVGVLSAPAAAEPALAPHGNPRGLANAAFRPVAPNKRDAFSVAEGFASAVVIRWGDPVVAGAPRFDPYQQSVAAARKQFGYNNDYVGLLPLRGDRALLVVNHEYTDEVLMFPADTYTDAEIKEIAMSNHGMSVVEVKRGRAPGSWKRVTSLSSAKHNRRLHIETEFKLSGPAAGDPRLRTTADPSGRSVRGTLNNCAGGTTPWGTVLSGEENFNQYFDASGDLDEGYADQYARYGITGAGKGWSEVDPRFDLTTEPHESHRFGWVVEVDPHDPRSTPRKHTMLGRLKHEGANIAIAKNGRAVAYMGDDERGDYMYKFVSAEQFDKRGTDRARRHNLKLLTRGTLYVAQFTGDGAEDDTYDGTGKWIPLCSDTESFVPDMSVADVLIFTRLAADKVAATKMDRPEDVEPNPANGYIYAALTNNSNRGSASLPADEANPITSSMVRSALGEPLTAASGNRNGYVLELRPSERNHAVPHLHLEPAAGMRRPRGGGDLLRWCRQEHGQPDQLPGQRRVRHRRQPVDLHRRQRPRLQRRDLPGADQGPPARAGAAVRDRAPRRRGLRTADRRRRPVAVRRCPAPRRDRRLDVRDALQHLAAQRRLPSAVRRGGVPGPVKGFEARR